MFCDLLFVIGFGKYCLCLFGVYLYEFFVLGIGLRCWVEIVNGMV